MKKIGHRLLQMALAGLLLVAIGCTAGGDTSIYVRNDSQEAWYVKVLRNSAWDPCCAYWVARVEPGADAFAVSWVGGRSVPVSVLDLDCSVIGEFEPSTDDVYVVDGAPGLTGRIEDRGAPVGSRTTTPGINDTEACGGFMPR